VPTEQERGKRRGDRGMKHFYEGAMAMPVPHGALERQMSEAFIRGREKENQVRRSVKKTGRSRKPN